MELRTFINSYRKKHDLTMEEFAKLASLSKGYISMLERGYNPQTGKKNYTFNQRLEQYSQSNRNRPRLFIKSLR